jgi:hypothetical protein
MQEDRITDSENPYLDADDWQVALEPFEGKPQAALTLGINLVELKRRVKALDLRGATDAIDVAIDRLYEHSDFRSVSRELFVTALEGNLTTDTEDMLRELGLEI